MYSRDKIFHFGAKVQALAKGRLTAPVHVRLKPTNRCNHDCSYCCYRSGLLPLSERMDTQDAIGPDKLREIVRDLCTMGVKAVTFSGGGEPMLHPGFAPAVRNLKAGGVAVATLTNGSALVGDKADALAECADWVRVSMGGTTAETFSAVTGAGPDEMDRVCRNLESFARRKRDACVLGVSLVVTAENHMSVLAFLHRMKRSGVNHVKVSEVVVGTTFAQNRAYVAPIYDAITDQIERARAELVDDSFALVDKLLDPKATENLYDKAYTWCPFAQCLTVIAADRNVYACQDKAYTDSGLIGSIRDRSFEQMWGDDATKQRLFDLNPARDCAHHCVADTKNRALLEVLHSSAEPPAPSPDSAPLHCAFV